jgi:hypothetical protein
MPVIFFAPHRIISLIYFSFFFHFVMYWQGLYALFTIKVVISAKSEQILGRRVSNQCEA